MNLEKLLPDLAVLALVIVSLGFHEWAHALVATLRGDSTAKDEGRLTLNPIRHMDPMLTVVVPLTTYIVLPALMNTPAFLFGGAKPVPVVPGNLKSRHRDMALVAAAGPATNVVIAFVCLAIEQVLRVRYLPSEESVVRYILVYTAYWNIILTIFNLLPIPPLDGSRIVAYLLPEPIRRPYAALDRVGLILVLAVVLLFKDVVNGVMRAAWWTYDFVGEGADQLVNLVGLT